MADNRHFEESKRYNISA